MRSRLQFLKTLLLPCALAILVAGAAVKAQDTPADAFMKCAAETDEAARLACFDRVAREQAPPVPAEPQADADPQPVESSEPATPAAEPPDVEVVPAAAPAAIAITKSAPAETAPAAATVPPVEQPTADVPETADVSAVGPAVPEEEDFVGPPSEANGDFTATVRRVARQPRGEHVVYLENGQVWQENVKNSYFPVEIGDTVTFRKRRFGGYRLITESGRAYEMKRLR